MPTESSKYNWLEVFEKYGAGNGVNILENKEALVKSYISQMLRRTSKFFKWNNLPDTILERELERQLQLFGFSIITKVDQPRNGKAGLYALIGGIGGKQNAYYLPTQATPTNPYLGFNKTLKIDEECVLAQNDLNFEGLYPLFNKYASLLADIDMTIRMVTINSRAMSVLYADNDDVALEVQNYIETLLEGTKIGFISGKRIIHAEDEKKDSLSVYPYTSTGASELIKSLVELRQYIKGSLWIELGLNDTFNMKREALSDGEINLNEDILQPFIDEMLDMRKMACEKINALYGTDISVELSSAWKERKEENELRKEMLEKEIEEPESEVKEDEQLNGDKEKPENVAD